MAQNYRYTTIQQGISFGSALAIVISFTTHYSILWAIIHGIFLWLYVIYYLRRPPRAIASKVTSGQYFSQIGVVPSGLEPFGLDANLGRLLLLEQTHGNLSQEGHIFRGMAGAYP